MVISQEGSDETVNGDAVETVGVISVCTSLEAGAYQDAILLLAWPIWIWQLAMVSYYASCENPTGPSRA